MNLHFIILLGQYRKLLQTSANLIIIYLSFLNYDWLLIQFYIMMQYTNWINSFSAIAFELYSSMARALGL